MYTLGTKRLANQGTMTCGIQGRCFRKLKTTGRWSVEAKEKLISRAEQLATTTDWKKGGEEFKSY